MAGVPDTERPTELLDAIHAYLVKNGVADVSLRPLAKAVGSSPRALLYHFGSKEKMIDRVLSHIREQQHDRFAEMSPATFSPPSAGCREIWCSMTTPRAEPLFRLYFQIYSLALQHPRRFADFLHNTVTDWLEFIGKPMLAEGYGKDDARVFSTVVLAGFRGLMLDYCATHDRRRLNRALNLWLKGLDATPLPKPQRSARRQA